MRQTVRKFFWVWDFDQEQKWLNEMAAKGLALISVGLFRYDFEDCVPGEYKICLQFLENGVFNRAENAKYIEFLEETGAEHVGTFNRWAYFRKKAPEADFALFSDHSSQIRHLTRVIAFIAVFMGLNLYLGCYNMYLYFGKNSFINIVGVINLLVVVLGTIGLIRLVRKRNGLKSEQQVFE